MKFALTVALLIAAGISSPAQAQKITTSQRDHADHACRKQTSHGVPMELQSITVLADGRLSVQCREKNSSLRQRQGYFDEANSEYEEEVKSNSRLLRVLFANTATPMSESEADQAVRNSSDPGPVFTVIGLLTLVLSSTSSTTSTNGTAP